MASWNPVRSIVSKKKKRFTEDGFDLDLTYITPRIIAMGFPSSGVEGMYRNPLPEVQRFFEKRHGNHYKIYNLCSERSYDLEGLFREVEVFPFDDHNPCAMKALELFCASVDSYFLSDPQNVVGIHCKAGKGRTGTMIAAYLLHSGVCTTAEDALAMFGRERTHNSKGVTIPSQIRYVHYYEALLRRAEVFSYTYQITHIRMITVPNFDPSITGGGCDPYCVIKVLLPTSNSHVYKSRSIFNQSKAEPKVKKYYPHEKVVDLELTSHNIFVRGDVNIVLWDQDKYSDDDVMCNIWINTAFVERNYLVFDKSAIDRANKDKFHRAFDADFKVEVFLHKVNDDDFVLHQDGEHDDQDDAPIEDDDDDDEA